MARARFGRRQTHGFTLTCRDDGGVQWGKSGVEWGETVGGGEGVQLTDCSCENRRDYQTTPFPWAHEMTVRRSRVLLPHGHSALDAGSFPVPLPVAITPGRCVAGPNLTRCRFFERRSGCILL